MEKIKYEVAAPKASALIYSLRSFGYSLTAAIADIIDNSVAAGANRIETQFNIDNPENPWISITDNSEFCMVNVIKLSKLRLLAVSSLMARSLFRFCRPF